MKFLIDAQPPRRFAHSVLLLYIVLYVPRLSVQKLATIYAFKDEPLAM